MGSTSAATAPRQGRKVYTISKAREKWTDEEHTAFVEALQKRGRNWKAIVQDIGTRTVAQVRSHAQKYFLRLEKEGHQDEIPPPRPKKRAARPYPVQAREPPVQNAPPAKARKTSRGVSAGGSASGSKAAAKVSSNGASQAQQPAADAAAATLAAAAAQAEADANFSKLYAIVGSMFDSAVPFPEQLTTIHQLPTEQREPLLLMLGHLTANLRETVRNQRPVEAVLAQLPPLQGLEPAEQPTEDPLKPRSHRSRPRKGQVAAPATALALPAGGN